jgi:hypothetical protein
LIHAELIFIHQNFARFTRHTYLIRIEEEVMQNAGFGKLYHGGNRRCGVCNFYGIIYFALTEQAPPVIVAGNLCF